jgi:RNA-directed DNA polymerase
MPITTSSVGALEQVCRAVKRCWRRMLCSRSWAGRLTWDAFNQIKQRTQLLPHKLRLPHRKLQALAVL